MKEKRKTLSRRSVVKGIGGTGILLFVGGCRGLQRKIQDFLDYNTERRLAMEVLLGEREKEVPWTNHEEKWFTTTCMLCPSRCGLSARIVDENFVYVKGNPLHPFSQGGLCPVGIAGLQHMYSPDRVISPMVREGSRGSGKWKQTGMRKAISAVEQMLLSNPEKVVFITSEEKTGRALLIKKFLSSVKKGYVLTFSPWTNLQKAMKIITGRAFTPVFDISRADLVMSFGFDFLGFSPNFMHFHRSYAQFRSKPGRKVRHIQVESRLSLTGSKSHKWLPVKPGTHHLIAQIIAYILIKENLVNRKFTDEFVEEYTQLRKKIVTNVNPSALARQAGVNIMDVMRIAREVASSSAPVFIPGPEVLFSENGDKKASIILALNFLTGNIQKPGGVLSEQNALELYLEKDLLKKQQGKIEEVSPSEIKSDFFKDAVVIITENHPFKVTSSSSRLLNMLKKARFICYWGTYAHDELARISDVLIPDATFLEREDVSLGISSFHLPVISDVSKIVNSPYEVHDLSEFLLKQIKQKDASFQKFNSVLEFKNYILKKLSAVKRGLIARGHEESEVVEFLERYGFWTALVASPADFAEEFKKYGAWWDSYYNYGAVAGIIKRSSGKANLQFIAETSLETQRKGSEKKFYAIPIIHQTTGIFSEHIYLPWMVELFGWERNERWRVWVEINPHTAAKLGLREGDMVLVRSASGEFKAEVKLFPGTQPGAVNFPLVKAGPSSGRWAEKLKENTFKIFSESDIYTKSSPVLYDTRVEVKKI